MRVLFALFLSIGLYADNEIYIDQTGDNAAIDIEQLGSSNIIGGLDSNKFLTDGILGDNFTGTFDFVGDSNEWTISMDTGGLNGADYVNLNFDITGSSNTADIDLGEDDDVSYLDLDWLFTGDTRLRFCIRNKLHGHSWRL